MKFHSILLWGKYFQVNNFLGKQKEIVEFTAVLLKTSRRIEKFKKIKPLIFLFYWIHVNITS